MKTAKNLFLALIAVALMATTFSVTAAETDASDTTTTNVSAKAPKALKDMTLEELLAFLRTLTPDEVASLMAEVLETNNVALVDTFGKAFATLVATADATTRNELLSSFYAANPGIVIADTGTVVPLGNLSDPSSGLPASSMEVFTAGNNSSTANQALIDSDVEVPEPHEYSSDATR